MPDYEFNAQDKIVQQMTRDGLIQENLATGEQENVSSKKADYEYNALKNVEKAINAVTDAYEYHKYYSASSDEIEEPEEESSEYKSPYRHGQYEVQKDSSSDNKKEEDETESFDKSRDKKEHFGKKKEDNKFQRAVEDYLLSRQSYYGKPWQRKPPDDNDNPPSGGGGTSGGGPPSLGGGGGDDWVNKWDKKIARQKKKVQRRMSELPQKRRLHFENEFTLTGTEGKTSRRLKFEKRTVSRKKYEKKNKKKIKRLRREAFAVKKMWNSWADLRRDNRDEIHASMLSAEKRAIYYGRKRLQKSYRNIEGYMNPYARLDRAKGKLSYYQLRWEEEEYKHLPEEKKKAQKELRKQLQKKRYQKEAIQKTQQQVLRHRKWYTRIKDGVMRVIRAVKTFFMMASSILSIFLIVFCILFGGFILLAIAFGSGAEAVIKTTYKSDYTQISECSAYMKKLETDLEEEIGEVEEDYPGYFEYVYDLGEIGHNPVELMSYLAAKFVEFDFQTCKSEIEVLFAEMYELTVEIKEEIREREKKDTAGHVIYDENGEPIMEPFLAEICYVTLKVTPLSDVTKDRMDAEQKEYYEMYMESQGGQQVYSNCMPQVEWGTNISSRFGERIHPISGERTFHNGIDIAVPTGTNLYSSCEGVVITSAYSDTAGHYIVVEMKNGWSMKYMHLDSRSVNAGEIVEEGQFIGQTGNSGNSTGPHLHLEVRDAAGNPIDPTFMIPSSSVIIEPEE